MQVEDLILAALANTKDDGLDDLTLKKLLPCNINDEARIQSLNTLVQRSRVQVMQRQMTGLPFFKFISEDMGLKLRDLAAEE